MKNYLLSSVAAFGPQDDKNAAKEEREKINVTVTANNEDKEDLNNEQNENENTDKENENNDETNDEKSSDDEKNDDSEDEKEKDEEKELSAKVDKDKRKQDRMQRRIDKATAEAKAAKAEAVRLQKLLEAKPDDEKVLTEEEVEKRSEEKARQKLIETQFVNDCNKLADEAEKVDKDFTKKINLLTEDIGPIPGHMIGILSDLDNGGKVLSHLANNEDLAEDIWKLTPAKMALKLSRLSDELNKKPKKEISKVPEPNKGLGGKGGQADILHDKMNMDDWVQLRNKQVAERQAAKRNAMR